jgi:hypothetical protein
VSLFTVNSEAIWYRELQIMVFWFIATQKAMSWNFIAVKTSILHKKNINFMKFIPYVTVYTIAVSLYVLLLYILLPTFWVSQLPESNKVEKACRFSK